MNNSIKNKIFIFFIMIFVSLNILLTIIGVLAIKSLAIKSLAINIDKLPIYNKIVLMILIIVSIMVCCYIEIIIHELGHFIAGKLVKFKFYSFTIFPVCIKNIRGRIKFHLNGNSGLLGSCLMYPQNYNSLSARLIIYYSGGIIFNFIFINVYLFFITYVLSTNHNIFIKVFISLLLIISQLNLFNNMRPAKVNGMKSDGAKILALIETLDSINVDFIEIVLLSQLFSGIRPKELNFDIFKNINIVESKKHYSAVDIYFYYHYLDNKNIDKAEECIDVIEKNINKYDKELRVNIMYEILCWYCYIKKDFDKVDQIYKQISQELLIDTSINGLKVKVAYELYINKDKAKTLELAKHALSLDCEDEVEGISIFQKTQIERMVREVYQNNL